MSAYVVSPPSPATHRTPARCSPGTTYLARAIKVAWPELLVNEGPYGCFNRRSITGSTVRSVHGDGRALDIGVGHTPTEEQMKAMAEMTWKLTAGCYVLGIQRMLWNRHAWTAASGWHPSTSMGGPHLDHMHLEQTPEAAWKRPPDEAQVRCALGLA